MARSAFLAGLHSRMRTLREGQGMSQTELARRLKCTREQWSKYETRSPLPLDLVVPFCRLMGCEVEYLLVGRAALHKRNGTVTNLTEFRDTVGARR